MQLNEINFSLADCVHNEVATICYIGALQLPLPVETIANY